MFKENLEKKNSSDSIFYGAFKRPLVAHKEIAFNYHYSLQI